MKKNPMSSTLDNRTHDNRPESTRLVKASQLDAGQKRKWLVQDRASISSMNGSTNR